MLKHNSLNKHSSLDPEAESITSSLKDQIEMHDPNSSGHFRNCNLCLFTLASFFKPERCCFDC